MSNLPLQWIFPVFVCAGAVLAAAVDQGHAQTNAPASHSLLYDSLGRAVRVPTNDVYSPPASLELAEQIPTPARGVPQPDHVQQRIADSKLGRKSLEWFPAMPPMLPPYLANLDEFGNSALQPGGLFAMGPISRWAQSGKYWLSEVGLRETFYQSLTVIRMPETVSGENTLSYYAATFLGKWSVFEMPNGSPAGWLSVGTEVQLGLTSDSRTQSPQKNLGMLVNPQANVTGPNGVWIPELAWQQSLLEGKFVFVAGQVDQGNYLDVNSYANNSQSQFLNGALVNSSVLPLPSNNLGANFQWQSSSSWYVLFGTGANNQTPGQSPFHDLGFENWSYLLELGLTPTNVFGLGPGVYRFQPFVATVDGQTQAGVGLNVQQQLGPSSPFGLFGRFGVGGSEVMLAGAQAQASVGLSWAAPLQEIGLAPRLSNDTLGLAFIWSQAANKEPVSHENEYVAEMFYALQLTPTIRLQPDVQIVWNSAFNPDPGPTLIWQLQLNIAW